MSEPCGIPSRPADGAASGERLLEELEAALSDQLALAQDGDFQRLLAASDRLERLLRRATETPGSFPPGGADRLKRIGDLRRRLALTLAQKKQELAGKLNQIQSGKRLLRAYRGNSSRR